MRWRLRKGVLAVEAGTVGLVVSGTELFEFCFLEARRLKEAVDGFNLGCGPFF
jgi:hypothetical protein